ncbi:hypothetical protein D0Z08_17050 [Nocardioides immobilis]|uniref:Sulfotransferase domain-containing protein n=1 Tax=Nocardioides immobilis TaxID=2049295 RepID=A0A417Y051_9ACTN|nr:hypothetical protein [Nocardioides immobilis]RHW26030.1 hypothetical protein D0Z08_17050 [Nocardioides immobilis]
MDRLEETVGTDVRLIFTFRRFTDFAYSRYLQKARSRRLAATFLDELEGKGKGKGKGNFYHPLGELLERYVEQFGSENFLFMEYEKHFKRDAPQFEEKIYDFLGLPNDVSYYSSDADEKVNAGYTPRFVHAKDGDYEEERDGAVYRVPKGTLVYCNGRGYQNPHWDDPSPQVIEEAAKCESLWTKTMDRELYQYVQEKYTLPLAEDVKARLGIDLSYWDIEPRGIAYVDAPCRTPTSCPAGRTCTRPRRGDEVVVHAVIVGNSNCVFRFGFSKIVTERLAAENIDVYNLSMGGSCSLFHVHMWNQHRQLLETADLVILDSMIIDIYHRRKAALSADQVERSINDMYAPLQHAAGSGRVGVLPLDGLRALVPGPRRLRVPPQELPAPRHRRTRHLRRGGQAPGRARRRVHEGQPPPPEVLHEDRRPAVRPPAVGGRAHRPRARARPPGRGGSLPVADARRPLFFDLARVTHQSKHTTRTVAELEGSIPFRRFAGLSAMGVFQWNKGGDARLALDGLDGLDEPFVKQLRGGFAVFDAFTAEPVVGDETEVRVASDDEPPSEPPYKEPSDGALMSPHLMGFLFRQPGQEIVLEGGPRSAVELTPVIEDRIFGPAADA